MKGGTLTFKLQQIGLISGTGAVANTTAQCFTSTGGQVVGIPDPTAQPTVALTTGSGTLPGGIYYVQYTFYNGSYETLPSPELRVQLTNTGSLIFSPPTTFPAAATGMKIYVGTLSGSEAQQGITLSATAQYTVSAALSAGPATPTVNSSPCTIAFNDTIIPLQGYNVSLTSANGNSYPGWPQAWQLFGGPTGTINVSAGAPLWNGTVIYPTPILSQPLNHGPQSISGNFDHGGYNDTNIGVLTASSVNGVVNPVIPQSGVDLGTSINNAGAACGYQCTVLLPAGSFSYAVQIVLPQNVFGQYKVAGQPGTVLTWTGTTSPIVSSPISIGASNLTIEGFQLINAGSGTFAGIHLYPTNHDTVQNMVIQGFSDGILLEGVNSSLIQNNNVTNNINGVRLISTFCTAGNPAYTCSPTNLSGTLYAANKDHIVFNQINHNFGWGVIFGDSPGNGDSGALSDVVFDNDLEQNGLTVSGTGALYAGKSTGLFVEANYLEGSPRQIVLGLLGGGSYYGTEGAHIGTNFWTTLPATPFNIELQNADRTLIDGNTEQGGAGVGSGNCFVNVGGVETNTLLIPNGIIQGQTVGNRICIGGTNAQTFAGAGSYILFNTNYKASLAYGLFPITAAASDTQAAVNVASNSTCFATASNNAAQATAQGLIAQVYVQPGNGQFTIFHPTGHAGLYYDVWCSGFLN